MDDLATLFSKVKIVIHRETLQELFYLPNPNEAHVNLPEQFVPKWGDDGRYTTEYCVLKHKREFPNWPEPEPGYESEPEDETMDTQTNMQNPDNDNAVNQPENNYDNDDFSLGFMDYIDDTNDFPEFGPTDTANLSSEQPILLPEVVVDTENYGLEDINDEDSIEDTGFHQNTHAYAIVAGYKKLIDQYNDGVNKVRWFKGNETTWNFYIKRTIEKVDGKRVCIVECKICDRPINAINSNYDYHLKSCHELLYNMILVNRFVKKHIDLSDFVSKFVELDYNFEIHSHVFFNLPCTCQKCV